MSVTMRKKLRQDFEFFLNEVGCPHHDSPEHHGRVPYSHLDKYGTWLRINDPIAFNVGYNEHLLKNGIKDYE